MFLGCQWFVCYQTDEVGLSPPPFPLVSSERHCPVGAKVKCVSEWLEILDRKEGICSFYFPGIDLRAF